MMPNEDHPAHITTKVETGIYRALTLTGHDR